MSSLDRDKLRALIAAKKITPRELSRRVGDNPYLVRDILSGKSRNPRTDTIAKIAMELGVDVSEFMVNDQGPTLKTDSPSPRIVPRLLPVRYRAQAGHWYEVEFEEPPSVVSYPVAPDPRYSSLPQWLEEVVGDSANQRIQPGQLIHVVDAIAMGYAAQEGHWVVVERRRDQGRTRERSVKQVHIRPDGVVELWPRSTNPKWSNPLIESSPAATTDAGHPIETPDGIEVEIVGLVVGAYDPFF